jgi:calcineurin-like phosphoesterase
MRVQAIGAGAGDLIRACLRLTCRRLVTRKDLDQRMGCGEAVKAVCGVYVETDDRTGLATRIEPSRVGGRLKQTLPEAA